MNYYEIKIKYHTSLPDEVVADILSSELGEIGFESFVQEKRIVTGYIQENLYSRQQLNERLGEFPLVDVSFSIDEKLIISQDWNEEWEKNYFKPIRIGKECIIRASFHEDEPGYSYPIIIDPKMAFGTGNHETTYLMISEMLKEDFQNKEVLDMGCGTAVLAILAAMKNADRVVGIDIDEWAYNNALENIRLNRMEKIQIALGGSDQIGSYGPFDIIFANINRNILLEDMETYCEYLRAGGSLYMSGFYKDDIPVIEAEANRLGLTLETVVEKNNWVAIKTKK